MLLIVFVISLGVSTTVTVALLLAVSVGKHQGNQRGDNKGELGPGKKDKDFGYIITLMISNLEQTLNMLRV